MKIASEDSQGVRQSSAVLVIQQLTRMGIEIVDGCPTNFLFLAQSSPQPCW